ncbi:MAG: sorbosone dehydrogenase family protein [Gemmatimonadota bacterium]
MPGVGPDPELPPPFATDAATNFPEVVGWPEGRSPVAPAGFLVSLYAGDLAHPRWLYQLPNGDVLVAESNTEELEGVPPPVEAQIRGSGLMGPSADRVTLLRDADGDGTPEVRETFLEGLNQPFGMLLLGDLFYVANTDAVLRFPYRQGQTRIEAAGEKILDLPAGSYNNHWTRNIVASPDGSKIYVTVGSQTNVDEEGRDAKEPLRAAILEANPDGSGLRIFASGLRNPNGLDWQPATGVLWTVVNERDGLGDDLVPDFLTSVREDAFYGWPYSYWGSNVDPRKEGERPDLVAQAIAPDYGLGAHTASLGLAFYDGDSFPERYRGAAFVGQHGSWNRSRFSGYKVIAVPFEGGRPAGMPEDFLTGFVAETGEGQVYGRPVGVLVLLDGSLLVADDASDRIWRATAQ